MSSPHPSPGAASGDRTGRFVRQPNGRVTPLSPHLQTWRWHVTMAASILFRVTIGAASVAAIFVLAWIAAAAFGPEAYARFIACAGSPLGLVIAIGLTLVLFSFLLNGGRHLINDNGAGLDVKSANLMSWVAILGPVALTVLFWIALFASGRVSL